MRVSSENKCMVSHSRKAAVFNSLSYYNEATAHLIDTNPPMHHRLLEITSHVEKATEALLIGYEVEVLYNFRVGARRIRSILKQIDNHRSRGLRKTWGGFAAVTGPARDWDVFLLTAEPLLAASEFQAFRQLHEAQIVSNHEAVLEMIRSAPWRRHMREWKQFLEQAEENTNVSLDSSATLALALQRAGIALHRALHSNDDHHWHKFRIAVKEVRYVAESAPDDPLAVETTVACRQLQTRLGDWHDTVVQLNLLDELPPAPVHSELEALIQTRQQEFLSQLRADLLDQELFKPHAPETA